MKHIIQGVKDRNIAERQKEAALQARRKERLQQLELTQQKSGFRFSDPIAAIKEKKEMKALRKEIAAYEKKQSDRRVMIGLIVGLAVLMSFVGVMAALDKSDADFAQNDSVNLETDIIENTDKSVSNSEDIGTTDEQIATEDDSTNENNQTVQATTPDGLKLTSENISVSTETDYAHIDSDVVTLGENEGVTIKIEVSKSNVSLEDLIIYYDESILNVIIDGPIMIGETTQVAVNVTGKKTGTTEFVIGTVYDVETKGEEAPLFVMTIRKLDATEGRIVYVTHSGEKYHFSKNCVGERAIKTTYKDVVAYEYEPCGKCAK